VRPFEAIFMADERVERRLAAVLAADVAEYSRLMGDDEEGTLAALKACRRDILDPQVAAHRPSSEDNRRWCPG
jgi:adenylate cyclase